MDPDKEKRKMLSSAPNLAHVQKQDVSYKYIAFNL